MMRHEAIYQIAYTLDDLPTAYLRLLAETVTREADRAKTRREKRRAEREELSDRKELENPNIRWAFPEIHSTKIPETVLDALYEQPVPFVISHPCSGLADSGAKILAARIGLQFTGRLRYENDRRPADLAGRWMILCCCTRPGHREYRHLRHGVPFAYFPARVHSIGYKYASFQAWAGTPPTLRQYERVLLPCTLFFEPIVTSDGEFQEAIARCGFTADELAAAQGGDQ